MENAVAANDSSKYKSQSIGTSMALSPEEGESFNKSSLEKGGITMIAKLGKERLTLSSLNPETTIGELKVMLEERTRILSKRQKLLGLVSSKSVKGVVTDDLKLSELKIKNPQRSSSSSSSAVKEGGGTMVHEFLLMGTPEEEIFIDPMDREDLPDVVDDFDLDFNAGSEEWLRHVAVDQNLKSFTEKTEIHMMNPTRGKPLLVLDLDHTLLDFSSKKILRGGVLSEQVAQTMKRPFMDEFLTQCFQYYDLAVWSQTSWRWLETKLTELGMLTHPGYKFCFVLDKTSMFTIDSQRRNGTHVTHHVKPLQIIWTKLPFFSSANTVHVDDLSRNFALNLSSGLQVTAYHRKSQAKSTTPDTELWALGHYLKLLAQANVNFDLVDFSQWRAVCNGSKDLLVAPHHTKPGKSPENK